ncbi:MAG: Uracil-DNA glycosylase, family 4 [uncultured Thermoleophilia bacterium]|uniref:Type-4 uracil-DNA glycosylase n=1 Tax=uncultured Thermoleophilia bacterium TaxID=1497501 RepID=A0A6J4TFT6_9ACTN|nr:MAG: Uracil-DNA glycosylase, family 4 [uncultured Thermoleophilia bacterium]
MSAAEELAALADEIRRHRGCGFEPCETCTNPVPGEGPAPATLMLVGEAPGAQEDRVGRPFVGAAGRLLDGLLTSIDVPRDRVFITNVLKARPPGNRDPRPDEVAHARPWLDAQLALVRPRLVVTLGRHALDAFAPGLKITQVHGQVLERDGRTVLPLYHPAAALRVRPLREALQADVARIPALLGRAAQPADPPA